MEIGLDHHQVVDILAEEIVRKGGKEFHSAPQITTDARIVRTDWLGFSAHLTVVPAKVSLVSDCLWIVLHDARRCNRHCTQRIACTLTLLSERVH